MSAKNTKYVPPGKAIPRVATTLRLPGRLVRALEKKADAAGVPLNQLIVDRIEAALDKEGK